MIIELGTATEFIRVTAEYSNVVMVAMLPYFGDFAQKLDLPVTRPMTASNISYCGILPWRDKDGGIAGGTVTTRDGWSFTFQFGHVTSFSSPHCYYGIQDPNEIPKYFGAVRMTKTEAVQLARGTLAKLGVPPDALFAEFEPRVTEPLQIGTNTVPHFLIEWLNPFGGSSVRLDINANARRVESLSLSSRSLWKPPPKVNLVPPRGQGFGGYSPPRINPEYASRLVPIMLRAISEYGNRLSLPLTQPVSTNHIARIEVHDNDGWPHCEITLTNNWRFVYRHCMVNGHYSPSTLFNPGSNLVRSKDFIGKWNLTTNQAVEVVKKNVARLNYPTNNIHLEFRPNVICARGEFLRIFPRYFLEWQYAPNGELQSKIEAEVNADTGKLESLYYDHVAYWNCRPPIDVPISLPQPVATNGTDPRNLQQQAPRAPSRPFRPFVTPGDN